MKTIRDKLKIVALGISLSLLGTGNASAEECKINPIYNPNGDCKISVNEYIDTKLERKLGKNFDKKSKVYEILKERYGEGAKNADVNNDGMLSYDEMVDSTIRAGRERKAW